MRTGQGPPQPPQVTEGKNGRGEVGGQRKQGGAVQIQ